VGRGNRDAHRRRGRDTSNVDRGGGCASL
jgi:hypothetical protein